MTVRRMRWTLVSALACVAVAGAMRSATVSAQAPATRPMTFLDMQQMRSAGSPTPSRDGKWMLYTVSSPNWQDAERQTDLYLVSIDQGVSSTRQLTFTTAKNETSPQWAPDGSMFFFLSNREAPANASSQNQLYMMRADGGEARRITDAKDGVTDYAIAPVGAGGTSSGIVYRSGKTDARQLYRLLGWLGSNNAVPAEIATEQLTRHATGVDTWRFSPDGRRVYFISPDKIDDDEKARREKKFTVNIRNMETPFAGLWSLDLSDRKAARIGEEGAYSVSGFTMSDDSKWVGFRGGSIKRYERNITAENLYADLYLYEVATGQIERLTNNVEVGESGPNFSPDGRFVVFSAPDEMTRYSMANNRLYIRPVADRGKAFRKLDGSFDGDLSAGFWSKDGRTIYFNEGWRATNQLFALDVDQNTVRQITKEPASITVTRDDDSGCLLINFADGKTPPTLFTAAGVEQLGLKTSWRQLTDPNPQVRGFALGQEEEITWTSTDGTKVGGVLVKPVGYQPGTRYPLIVAIHGGPASADVLSFNGGYGAQVYAGAGYAVLRPNYRGSTNYGVKHKTAIVGDYFKLGYDDIMTGVDYLIAQGIVDGSKMGALGWSAGGHWSNWILTHTDRFKAISTGAGTSNWISMYAQSDVQRNRQFYLGDKLPYDDYDAYWNQSPLKYIRNARTPTMIHVVEGDPRVPSPQSVELHMALKQIGVPTELFMYPGNSHGIPDARNQLVKSVSEMAWMDYYVRGKGEKFSWRMVMDTLK
ncbi:MAG TPA: S9 family peptidase [Vicinamibacterales bacterium]|nr:S9 family peptidase [Vicinamibacterales bacterium]